MIVDVWTQHISPTPPGVNPEGENVFRNYGMLDVFHQGTDVARMLEARTATASAPRSWRVTTRR